MLSTLDLALHMAALRGQERIVRRHLAQGADPTATDTEGFTALALAVRHGHPRVVAALLPVSNVHAEPRKNGTDLLTLAANNLLHPTGPAVLMLLLNAGADPRTAFAGERTPLHAAAQTRRPPGTSPDDPVPEDARAAFQALLAVSDPTAQDTHGITPLLLAAGTGEFAWLDALLPVSDPNVVTPTGWTPLMAAADQLYPHKMMRLLAAGADPRRVDQNGRSAAHVALHGVGTPAMFQELVRRGAPIGSIVTDEPTLAWAAARVDTTFLDTVLAQDPQALARDGTRALVNALQTGTETAIDWLEARLPLATIGQALADAWPMEPDRVWNALNQRWIAREQQALHAALPSAAPAVRPPENRSRL